MISPSRGESRKKTKKRTPAEMIKKLVSTKQALEKNLAKLTQQQHEMQLLNELSSKLQTCSTENEAYETVAYHLLKLIPNATGHLYVMEPLGNYLELICKWGKQEKASTLQIKQEDCLALRSKTPYYSKKAKCNHYERNLGYHGYLCIPLLVQKDIIGLLCLLFSQVKGSKAYDKKKPAQLLNINSIAKQVAFDLFHFNLREVLINQSIRDPMTGLYNRRYFEQCLGRELQRSERNNASIAIIMFDIDHFKQFNDKHGHAAGDAVLIAVANVLNEAIRAGSDVASRYGGEEFIVYIPGISVKKALERGENIRKKVSDRKVFYHGLVLPKITVSAGIAIYPEHGKSVSELIEATDKALYIAKNTGRDKTFIYSNSPSP